MKPQIKGMKSAAKQTLVSVVGAIAVAASASMFFAVLGELNSRILPGLPWGAVAALAVSVGVSLVIGIGRRGNCEGVSRIHAGFTYAAVATLVGFLGVGLNYLQTDTWSASLPGDKLFPTSDARNFYSLAVFVSSAFVEESAVRGCIQLKLQPVLGAGKSEVLASVVFALLHADRFATWEEVVFVLILAAANGRITRASQSIGWPIAVHAIANVVVLGVVVTAR